VPARGAGEAFAELVAVMDRLRSPGGCPWDAAQTHASLAPYAIEEAYEVADAAERGDAAALVDELGDLLLQVVFHARVAEDDPAAPFDVTDVVEGLVAKLRRRHPHVFGDVVVADAAEVATNWEQIKARERAAQAAAPEGGEAGHEGVPLAMPALARAQKVVGRGERAGRALPGAGATVGDRLLALVVEAARAGLDAEAELRRATARWEDAGGPGLASD
jgi:XTP/dITP diphosphohydrolase